MGVLTPVIEIPTLAMLHPGEDLAFRRTIALQLVRNDDPRHVLQSLQQLAEKLLRRLFVASALHQDIEDGVVLIHRTPQIMAFPVDRQKDLVDVIVTTHKTLALVFHTQVDKLKRDMSKNNRPASAASCAFMQNDV